MRVTGKQRPLAGLGCALTANLTWAGQVLYWPLLAPSSPTEMLAYRVVFATVCAVLLTLAAGGLRDFMRLLADNGTRRILAGTAACLTLAWGVYIYAVVAGVVLEAALGLFLIPLATAAVGVLVFGERLRTWQCAAIGLAVAATVVMAAGFNRAPWIAIGLCALMAAYSALKKQARVPAVAGHAAECVLALPLAAGILVWLQISGDATMGRLGIGHALLMIMAGLITAVPLIAHAASINLLPLAAVGLLQYLNPTVQFALGVVVLHHTVSVAQWTGFALIWLALLVYSLASRPAEARAALPSSAPLPRPARS